MPTVYIKTLGCKVNTFDSSALHREFNDKGYTVTNDPGNASIIVVNTCSVTERAEKEARYLLRRYSRESPQAFKVVTGCYAQTAAETLAASDDVDLVVTNEAKPLLISYIEQRQNGTLTAKLPLLKSPGEGKNLQFKTAHTFFATPVVERVRGFLKIQDGCDGFCAYCQIPYSRGASRSVPPAQVIHAAREIVATGIKEITLTGIHIGDYGQDSFTGADLGGEGKSILAVLKELLTLPGLKRLRISSLEPSEVSPELLDLLAEHPAVFCDHFHLPLQAGSDRILKSMGRAYDLAYYADTITAIRQRFPAAQLSADVLPGFPGETEQDFADTLAFVKSCGFGGLHVFPYSKRPHTRALRFPGHLSPEIIRDRAKILRKLGEELSYEFRHNLMGSSQQVLWESWDQKTRRFSGKTKNYVSVLSAEDRPTEVGTISEVTIKGFLSKDSLLAW